jgi:glycosyltransferase involved in cell wall biosynthesis
MKIPSEAEMLDGWGANSFTPIVSICCPTFNQENLIESAIKGFLIQKTSFPFEIIIRDDASHDETVVLLKRYQKCYPKIIKLILKKSNKLKLGHKSLTEFGQQAKGKFIALCDGDDYWQNPFKLQKQHDILTKCSNASFCFHQMETDEQGSVGFEATQMPSEYESISKYQVISKDGGFIHTSSIMYRNENTSPVLDFIRHAPVGDCFLQFYLCFLGDPVFLKGSYGIRRVNLENNWTSLNSCGTRAVSHHLQMGISLIKFLDLTPRKYQQCIVDLSNRHFLRCLRLKGVRALPSIIKSCGLINFLRFLLTHLVLGK